MQQLREAFPEAGPYQFAIFDRDSTFNDEVVTFLKATGLKPKRTSVQAPWQNGIAEYWQVAYREAKRAAFSQSIARLHQMSSAAVSTLGKIMVDANAPASTRVRAADSILNHTTKAIEIEDIAARVAALEEATQIPGQKR